MSKCGFGDRLKRERELRGVSRQEVCAATRIGNRFLEALETEKWEILPGGVFNRGFVRAVARFLGLDEDNLVAEYDLALSEQNPHTEESLGLPAPQEPMKSREAHFALVAALCLIVLLGIGDLGWRWHLKAIRQTSNSASLVPSAPALAPRPEVNAPATSSENGPGTASTAPAAPANPGPEAPGLELKVEAGKETALSVSADGNKVFEGSMIAGQSRTFTAQQAIDISAKDAGALLLELNGQTLAPLGPPGRPGTLTLTRSDVKPTSGGAD